MNNSFYSACKNAISSTYNFVKAIPMFFINQNQLIRGYIDDFRYKLKNITQVNIDLGIYHLENGNVNDAITRFKLVNKIFAPDNPEALYWLGWCYFLKNNLKEALVNLKATSDNDKVHLGDFISLLDKLDNISEVPVKIWQQYRDLTTRYYVNNFLSDNKHLPYNVIDHALSNINISIAPYSILELGSNIGIFGEQIKRRFPGNFTLTGVEVSGKMIESIAVNYPKIQIYDRLLQQNIVEFLNVNVAALRDHLTDAKQFEIIISGDGLAYNTNLAFYLDNIYMLLKDNGYFIACVPLRQEIGDESVADVSHEFSLKRKIFTFTEKEIRHIISASKFSLIELYDVFIKPDIGYIVFILQKNTTSSTI